MNIVTKDRILGKAWEVARYACYRKEMLGWICESHYLKIILRSGRFFASSITVVGNSDLTYNDLCIPHEDFSTSVGNSSWDNAHTSNPFNKGERLGGEPNILV